MAGQFIFSPVATRQALGASAAQPIFIMPNQPLSAVFITVEAQLTTGNVSDNLQSFLLNLTSIIFQWKGTAIVNLRGDDLVRMTRVLGTFHSRFEKTALTNNSRRMYVICIPFSRWLWNAAECFPKVDKGTTQLQINFAGDGNGYNTYKVTVEPLQLLGAQPTQFTRMITLSDTPAATGNKDYDLPRLYPLVGIGITTTTSEPAAALDSIENYKVLKDFVEYDYSLIQADLARAMQWFKRPPGFDDTEIAHVENTAGAYAQNSSTLTSFLSGDLTRNFHYLNFDPSNDGAWLLDASKASDLKLRCNYNVADATRIIPVELWPASTIPLTT